MLTGTAFFRWVSLRSNQPTSINVKTNSYACVLHLLINAVSLAVSSKLIIFVGWRGFVTYPIYPVQ